jgi:hypothetical protein
VLSPVPTLAEIAQNPERIDGLPLNVVAGLMTQLSALELRIAARVAMAPVVATPDHDQVLELAEAARRLGISPRTLQNRAQTTYKGLLVDNGTRRLAFSAAKIEDYKHAGPAHSPVPAGQGREGKRASSRPAQLPPELAYRRRGETST